MGFAMKFALAAALGMPAAAQWLDYPTPGIPRTSDGKPNLTAPAPRAADGKPDLSGIWEHKDARGEHYYLNGIDMPWTPWGRRCSTSASKTIRRTVPKPAACLAAYPKRMRLTYTRLSRLPD